MNHKRLLSVNFDDSDALHEQLAKARALIVTILHSQNLTELSEDIIHDYLWAVEQQISSALEHYDHIFNRI